MPRSPLPQEISDYVVDLLHDERDALKTCCLVSRSWIPRTRKHLFHEVAFHSFDDFEAWYETFQDPVNSPGCYTRSLSFGYPHEILGAAGVANQYHWVCRDFSNVVRLKLRTGRVYWSASSIVNLVGSLPSLKDLDVDCHQVWEDDDSLATFQPLTSPPLTGTLKAWINPGMGYVNHRLLELPNGVHFKKIEYSWRPAGDFRYTADLVKGCSNTIECVDFHCRNLRGRSESQIDFSDARRLKEVTFRLYYLDDSWICLTLQTLTSEHRDLCQISIHVPVCDYQPELTQRVYEEWIGIDLTLVRLWELHAVHIRLICVMKWGKQKDFDFERLVEKLLPEGMKREIYELIDHDVLR